MAEYSDSDLKGLMEVFQVKAEFIDDEAEPGEDDNRHLPEEENGGYIMVPEENDEPDDGEGCFIYQK